MGFMPRIALLLALLLCAALVVVWSTSAPSITRAGALEAPGPEASSSATVDAQAEEAGTVGRQPASTSHRITVRGKVIDQETEQPIEGATVKLVGGAFAGEEFLTTADGAFLLPAEGTPAKGIEVIHSRYVDTFRPRGGEEGDELLIPLRGSASIVGRVVSPRRMEPGDVKVQLLKSRSSDPTPLELKEDCTFEVHDLEPSDYVIAAQSEGFAASVSPVCRARAGVNEVEVVLHLGEDTRGKVVDTYDQPVANVRITASPNQQGAWSAERKVHSRTEISGRDGSFEFKRLEGGPTKFQLEPPWGGRHTHNKYLIPDDKVGTLTFKIPSPTELEGTVVDAGGEPVPGAQVFLAFGNSSWRTWSSIEEQRIAFLSGGELDPMQRFLQADDQGRFRLERVPSGVGCMVCAYRTEDKAGGAAWIKELKVGKVSVANVTLPLICRMEGTVTDDAGQPVPEANLSVWGGGSSRPYVRTQTGLDGRYTLNIQALGTVTVSASADGYGRWKESVDIDEKETASVDPVLGRSELVRGQVVDVHGCAVSGVRLRLKDKKRGSHSANSQEHGEFEIVAAEGEYSLDVSSSHYKVVEKPKKVTAPQEGIVVILERKPTRSLGTVIGEVVDFDTGAPISGLEIDGINGRVTMRGGEFRISGVYPGRIRFVAEDGDYETAQFQAELAEGATLNLGRREMRRLQSVYVNLSSETGADLQSTRAFLTRTEQPEREGYRFYKSFNRYVSPGRSWVGRVVPGEWKLVVQHGRHERFETKIQVTEKMTVDVVLKPKAASEE